MLFRCNQRASGPEIDVSLGDGCTTRRMIKFSLVSISFIYVAQSYETGRK